MQSASHDEDTGAAKAVLVTVQRRENLNHHPRQPGRALTSATSAPCPPRIRTRACPGHRSREVTAAAAAIPGTPPANHPKLTPSVTHCHADFDESLVCLAISPAWISSSPAKFSPCRRPSSHPPGREPGPGRRGRNGDRSPGRRSAGGSGCSEYLRHYSSITLSDVESQRERAHSRRSARSSSSYRSRCLQGKRRIGRYGACCRIARAAQPLVAAPLAA